MNAEIQAAGKNLFLILLQLFADLASQEEMGVGYGFGVDYGKIKEIVPDSSRTIIKISSGASGKLLITTPEQFDFVIERLQEKMMFAKRT